MVFEMLAQAEGAVENVTGAGLDPKLAVFSVIIAYVLQALRNIKWVDSNKGAMPFVALGLGVALAWLKLRETMDLADIVLSGCMLGLTASGFQAAASRLPMGMKAIKGSAVILLCFLLVCVGGCNNIADNPPTQEEALYYTVGAYTATMETLTALNNAGKLSDGTVAKIDFHRKLAWAALQEWRSCLIEGKPPSEAIRSFTTNYAVLIEAETP